MASSAERVRRHRELIEMDRIAAEVGDGFVRLSEAVVYVSPSEVMVVLPGSRELLAQTPLKEGDSLFGPVKAE